MPLCTWQKTRALFRTAFGSEGPNSHGAVSVVTWKSVLYSVGVTLRGDIVSCGHAIKYILNRRLNEF